TVLAAVVGSDICQSDAAGGMRTIDPPYEVGKIGYSTKLRPSESSVIHLYPQLSPDNQGYQYLQLFAYSGRSDGMWFGRDEARGRIGCLTPITPATLVVASTARMRYCPGAGLYLSDKALMSDCEALEILWNVRLIFREAIDMVAEQWLDALGDHHMRSASAHLHEGFGSEQQIQRARRMALAIGGFFSRGGGTARGLHASSARLPPLEIESPEEALLSSETMGISAARAHLIPDSHGFVDDEDLVSESSSSGCVLFNRPIPFLYRPATWSFGVVLPVFYLGYASAASVHMGSNPKGISPHAFDALLCLLLGVGLYSAGKLKDRLTTVGTWLAFTLFATLSTVSCTLFQEIVGTHMTLSLKSITHWKLLQWICAGILLSATLWCFWLHIVFAIRGRYLKQFVIGTTGALIAITFLTLVAEPTSDGLHLHHWFTAYLMAMICREPRSRLSFAWQSFFVGIWLHGASVWGIDSMWNKRPPWPPWSAATPSLNATSAAAPAVTVAPPNHVVV
ncbi:ATP-dependent RNA helicase A, partial [Perkinsus olseni]